MGRTSADITIHRIDGTTFNVPITTEARRTFGLGREDNIRLKWDGTTPYRARVGDWVNDELFGLFYVTEEQEPTVDSATGAYRHDIRFDRDYIGWKNVLHMLTYSDGGSIVRKETDWSLTDTLANHLKAVKDGLSALGYTMATSVVESGVDNSDSAVTISFAGTSVYDALNTIADAYRCEWWVTYNSDYSVRTIHMGKMELSGSAYPITLGDNAEDITPNKSDAETANRVYAFGSTRNIPDTYRKTLSFSVTDTATRTSDSRSATVFRDSARVGRQDMLRLPQALDFDLRLATPAYETNAGGQRYKAVFTDAMTIDRMVRYAATGNLEYTVEFVRDDASESTELEGYAWELRIGSNIIGSGAAMFSNHERVLGRAVKTVSVPVDESLVLQPGSTEARFSVWTNDGILVLSTASANSGVLSLKAEGYGIDCPLTFNGNTYTVTFNPLAEEITTSVFNWFAFSGQVPSGFAVGSKYTLGVSEDESDPGLLPLKIPVSFYTDDMGSLSVMKMIGERRLMLPTSTPGYVERGDTSVNRVVEKVVVFDNEYPKLCLQITEIEEGAYTDNTEWSDGSRSYGTLPKYTIKVKRVASGGSLADFPFKSDYLTTEPLKAVFMTRDEAVGHGAVPPSTAGFKLSGMTFGLNFSAAAQTYTIAFNEDYGAKLPNGILKPQVGDCLLLTGWNVAALTSLGLVSASENRLLSLANDYIDALQAPSHTYRCRMMSDSMMEDGLLEAGRKVVITRDDISDSTRVIGFEYKLDIPEDTPVYECGETETYSRLRALEKALNARSQSVSSSSGTLTSSYSQSGSESQPSQPASLTGKLYWKGGAVTDFEGDDFDGSEDKTLTVPTDISHLSGSGTLPRIGKVKETLEDGTKVIDLLDDSGTKLLPSANIDWFIVEELTVNEVTTYRLKLNPKYEGMYAEGWVSAGGVSEQGGGGGGTGYLRDLLDVNASMSPTQGQALVWDNALGKWTAGDVSVDLTPFERIANRVTTVSSSSNHTQYPTAKAVYDIVNTMLSSAMRFQGVTSTALVDGSTTNPVIVDGASYTATRGDVVVRSDVGLEYLWTGAKWQQLGDETSYAKKTVTITGSGYLTGGGNLEASRTIDIADAVKTKIDNGATAFSYFTDGAANEAIKLRTARKLWGQDFDGSADVSGILTGVNSDNTTGIGTAITIGCPGVSGLSAAGNGVGITMGISGESYYTKIATVFEDSNPRYLQPALAFYTMYNSYEAGSEVERMRISANGNVGFGTPSPAHRVDIAGDSRISGKVYIGTSGGYLEVVNVGTTASPVYALKSSLPFYSDSWVSAGGISSTGSGGGITGYLKDLLDVNGSMIPVDGQALVWDSSLGDNGRWTSKNVSVDLTPFERTTNKVTSISASSTDGQYPSARAVYNSLSGYLPLTGGTVTGLLTISTSGYRNQAFINRTNAGSVLLGFSSQGTHWGSLGVSGQDVPVFEDTNGNVRTLWHAGNDGTGSGLDADLLDGKHASEFVTNYGQHIPTTEVAAIGYGQANDDAEWATYGPAIIAGIDPYKMLLQSVYNEDILLWKRYTNGTYGSWKQIAFTDSNVATATKLETSRKLWGNDFNGTSDVNGSLEIFSTGGSYNEGIRVHPASNGWGGVVFASSDNTGSSGTTPNTWGIHNNEGRLILSKGGTSATPCLTNIGGNWGIDTYTPAYKLDVVGDVRASGKVYIGSTGAYFEVDSNGYLHTNFPLYSDSWISAGGLSDTGEGGGATYLKNLLDVDDNLVESAGYGLVYDGTQWTSEQIVPASRKINGVTLTSDVSLSLGSLSNVSVTGATNGQQLIYNGSEWIAGTPAGAKFFHGTCDTSSSSNTKVVDCPSFTSTDLVAGTAIAIVMYNRCDTTSTVTINVNGTGANTLLAGFANRKAWSAGELILAVYDGSGEWDMLPTWYYTYYYGGGGSGGGGGTGSTVVVTPRLSSGTRIATITVDGSATDLYAPSVSVTQSQGSTGGTQIASINSTAIYAPAVTVTQVQTSGVEVARIKVGSANPVSIFAPSGSSGSSGVQTVVGRTGDVTTDQIATALTNAGYKLTDTVQDLSGYLPLTAGSSKALTNTLYTRGLLPTANASYDLGSLSAAYNNTYTKRVYLADGVYIEYDSTNRCVYVHGAGIATDSFVSAGGVSTTSN